MLRSPCHEGHQVKNALKCKLVGTDNVTKNEKNKRQIQKTINSDLFGTFRCILQVR